MWPLDTTAGKEKHSNRNALLIKGAKGVGKTTLVKEFAKNEFKL